MIVVSPESKTSLLINKNYQAFAFCTARAAIRHFASGRVKGLDAENNTHDLDTWGSTYVQYYKDQPALRSAFQTWAIPTILLCSHSFGLYKRTGENMSLRHLYQVYKGHCQYCLEKITFAEATKDHVFPKSKGGTNHDFNLVLACRECNSSKDNHYPYLDVLGKEVKPKKVNQFNFLIEGIKIRDEWKPFLPMIS